MTTENNHGETEIEIRTGGNEEFPHVYIDGIPMRCVPIEGARRLRRPAKKAPSPRIFLTRVDATYLFGLMDASARKEPKGVVVACRDRRTGEVFEAQDGEVLHAQIAVRVGKVVSDQLDHGWTVPKQLFHKALAEASTLPSRRRA